MNEAQRAKVMQIIDNHGRSQAALITILQDVQAEYNYLSQSNLELIAGELGITIAKVYGVANFFENFSLEAKGKHIVKVCNGTACHVRKSQPIYDAVRAHLGLTGKHKTTDDGIFTLETVACLGAGGSMKVYEKLTALCTERGLKTRVALREEGGHDTLHFKRSGCQGYCEMGPLVEIQPEGILYTHVHPEDCEEILEKTILHGEIIERLLYKLDGKAYAHHDDIPFYKKQRRVMESESKNTLQAIAHSGLRGTDGIRAAELTVGDKAVRIGVVHGLANAKRLIAKMEAGEEHFDLVEVMTCTNGCVGGAGQPIGRKEQKYARAKGLYEADRKTLIKSSQHNPILKTLYEKLPPEKAHELLHVHYPQPE